MSDVGMLKNIEHKQKTIDNLVEYITNRVDENSNYCLFLGSGASINSNIKSGGQLIEEWREQLFNQENPNKEYSIEDAKNFFKQKHSSWYDENKEYSSFFERKYNLPSQRRKFVELAVENAVPSFGYHYLAKLIEKNYFNAIFTTNFDDLVEQAIDSHKSKRPIVCAQDSSVKSISVTSKRPKIIKLHGDFLFDDIQATITETHSLKDNMYDKFLEFAKNFGFIFVGYSGTDKSVIDTINALLKREDYFNDGIYWCIRKQDIENINENVRKLLWKDKVYYVLIDGFDELMAELYNKIVPKEENNRIPYDTDINKTIVSHLNYLDEQKKLFDNLYINDDIEMCKSNIRKTTQEIKAEKREYNSEESTEDNYSFVEERDIENKIKNSKFDDAIVLINDIREKYIDNSNIFNKLMKLLVECYVRLRKKQEAIEVCQQLICYNDENKQNSNVSIYLKMSTLRTSHQEKIRDIEKAIEIDNYSPSLQNIIGKIKTYYYPDYYSKEEILEHYNKSIDLDSSYINPSYFDKIYFLESCEDNYSRLAKTCEDVIVSVQGQDKFSKILYEAKMKNEYYNQKNNKIEKNEKYQIEPIKSVFNDFIENNKVYQRNIFYLKSYMNICSKISETNELKCIFTKYDIKYKSNVAYRLKKAICLLNNFRNLNLAIDELENIDTQDINYAKDSIRRQYYRQLAEFYLYDCKYDKAVEILNKNFDLSDTSSKDYSYIRDLYADILFFTDKDKHLAFIKNQFDISEKSSEDYIFYTYNLLKHQKYSDVTETINQCFKSNKYNSNKVLNINYLIAKKKISSKTISEDKVSEIINEKIPKLTRVGAYILRDKHQEAKEELIKLIEQNYSYFYDAKIMPVFKIFEFDIESLKLKDISPY